MKKIIQMLILSLSSGFAFGQNYLPLTTIHRQSGEIVAIATSENYFAAASKDKSVFVWDYSGNKMFKYSLREGTINALCFIPDSNFLLVAVKELNSKGIPRPVLKCFDITGKLLREFIDSTLTQEQVELYYKNNTQGSQNALQSAKNSFPQLDIKTHISRPQVKSGLSHAEFIENIALSPDQKFVATIDYFKILKVWDLTGNVVKTFQIQNSKKGNRVYFTSDTTLFISPNITLDFKTVRSSSAAIPDIYKGLPLKDKIYCYFDYNDPSEREKLFDVGTNTATDIDGVYSLYASASEDKFALLGVDGLIRIRNLKGDLLSTFGNDKEEVIRFRGKQIVLRSSIKTISFSRNSEYVVSGDENGKVIVWKKGE